MNRPYGLLQPKWIGYNTAMSCLPQNFYQREVLLVARDLLGKRLVRVIGRERVSGIIIETEAYRGEEDLACHARHGKTPRTEVMYGEAGRAYIYFTYGMHWLLNVVTGDVDFPAAVLLRAIVPVEGISLIAQNRAGKPQKNWCNGPAKICQALQISGSLNGIDLTTEKSGLWIEEGQPMLDSDVAITERIGIGSVPEPWKSIPWRFVASLNEKK
jgi:DNA-3-methyladenine glycosylase